MRIGSLMTDVIVIGSALFLIGTWLSSHHTHKVVTQKHPEHRVRQFLIYTCIGVCLMTVGSNMMTDGVVERLKGSGEA
jgi:hypothetical protein